MNDSLDPLSSRRSTSPRTCPNVMFKKIRAMFGRQTSPASDSEGYVEFGEFRQENSGVKKVGTFAGVFCPVVLSMFSAIIFIRMGYLVGNAGLYLSLVQLAMAYLIVLFTVLSICAISTNGAIEGGGVYFMISRSLGPEFGGAIGTLFFLANIASCALCISACTEGLVENFGPSGYLISQGSAGLPADEWWRFMYRILLNLLALGISLAGASLFARTSLAIFIIVFVSLASIFLSFFTTGAMEVAIPDTNTLVQNATFHATGNFTGLSLATLTSNFYKDFGRDYTANGDYTDFAQIFGVLFTGVTGVMAGANMSGLILATMTSNWYKDFGRDYTANGDYTDFAHIFGVLFTGVTGVLAGANMSGLILAALTSNLNRDFGRDYTANGDYTDFAQIFGVLFTGVTGVMAGANMSGLILAALTSNLNRDFGRDLTETRDYTDFPQIFGVLFTGVTGVMAVANIRGELKTPGRSIPLGTLSALGFTALCYIALIMLTASTCSRFLLQNNYVYLLPINIWPPFVAIGVLTVAFSAGLSNMIGASRVLEALAKDNIYGFLLSWAIPRRSNPIAAVISSWFLVQMAITVGSLNAIAQVVSVLFMTSYLAVNVACLGLDLASAPNFRPTFTHFSWITSACGLLGCIIVMMVLRPFHTAGTALAALCLLLALHFLSPAAQDARWGSLTQALIFHQVRKYLLLLDPRREHVKFWRPQMLLLVASPRQCCPLIDFVNDQKKGGLYVLGHVRIGSLDTGIDPLALDRKYWLSLVDHLKVKAFVELCLSENIRDGAAQLTRLAGLGAMKPDTVLVGFRDESPPVDFFSHSESPYKTTIFDLPEGELVFPLRSDGDDRLSVAEYVSILSDVMTVEKNLCVCRHFDKLVMSDVSKKSSHIKHIDIYMPEWCNPSSSDPFTLKALFALQLAAVVRSSRDWKHLSLRVWYGVCSHTSVYISSEGTTTSLSPSSVEAELLSRPTGEPGERLQELLKLLRINASVHKLENWNSVEELRWTQSGDGLSDSEDKVSYKQIPKNYVEKCNELIKRNSNQETAVTFILLPSPPRASAERTRKYSRPANFDADNIDSLTFVKTDSSDDSDAYMEVLKLLTRDLGPTILVNGIKSVTSTKL